MKKYSVFTLVLLILAFISITTSAQTILSVLPNNPTCTGSATGSVIVNITQTLPPSTAEIKLWWQNPNTGFWTLLGFNYSSPTSFVTNFPFPSLTAGIHRVDVVDTISGNLLDTEFFTLVDPPAISVIESTADVSCNAGTNGTATLTLSGGTGALNVNWFGMNPNNLPQGTHAYNVTDANGCTYNDDVVINEPPAISVIESTTDVSCNAGTNGTATLTLSGGTGILNLNWFGMNPNNLPQGTHAYSVTDANGCTYNDDVVINEPPAISVIESTTDVSCNAGTNGTATLTLSGGTGTLNLNWFGMNPNNLPQGTHAYNVTDANGCTYNDDVVINEPPAISVIESTTDVSCNAGTNGTATLTLSGGTGILNVNWFGMNPNNLPQGTHAYNVTDANGCTACRSKLLLISQTFYKLVVLFLKIFLVLAMLMVK